MARRSLDVIVQVRDAASGKLKNVQANLRGTGKAAREAELDFTKFNRTLFSTTAFVNIFSKAFSGLASSIEKGAEIDRVAGQFERVLGPKGSFFKNISDLTDNSIDRFEAMRSGISLRALGIVKDTSQIANIVARAGTAAKLAGKTSGEGIQQFTDFLKDGSVAHLEFLNLIAKTNPAFQAQMAILGKAGGIMGGVISTQARLALGQKLLAAATQNQMKGNRDLLDTMSDIKQAFFFLKGETGTFLGTALQPLIDKTKDLIFNFTANLENIRKTDKNLLFLAKTVILVSGAVAGLAATLGTLRLSVMALTSLGIGLPGLATTVILLTTGFLGLTSSVDSFMDKLRVLGAFFKGTFQLMHSFLTDPENFAAGIGKMDKSVHDMLQKNGLLELAKMVARVGSTIVTFVKDSIDALKSLANFVDRSFGGIARTLINIISAISAPWKRFWVDDQATFQQKAMRWVIVAGSLFAAFKGFKFLFGSISGLLTKLPVIGRFFGGGGRFGGPKGTKSDPIYTAPSSPMDSFFSQTNALIGGAAGTGGIAGPLGKAGGIFGAGGKFSKLLGKVGGKLGLLGLAIGAAGTAGTLLDDQATLSDKTAAGAGFAGNIAGALLGAKGGALAGGAIGGLFGGIGAVPGAAVGGTVGSILGAMGLGFVFEELARKITDSITGADNRTGIAIPKMPESQLDAIDFLGNQMKTMEETKRKKFASDVESALSASSGGGATITPEEWVAIFRAALDTSDKLNKIANQTDETPTIVNPTSRRIMDKW